MLKRIKNLLEHNAYLIAISVTILIAYLSLSNPIKIDIPMKISFLDKIFHSFAYFILTITWLFALRNYSKNKFILITLLLYGILIEFLQAWLTSTRQKEFLDVVANSIGILIALLIYKYLYKYFVKIFDN